MKNILAGLLFLFSSHAMAMNYFECHDDNYSLAGNFENERAEYVVMKNGVIFGSGEMVVIHLAEYDMGGLYLYLEEAPRNQVSIRLPGTQKSVLGPQLGFGDVNIGNDRGRFYASRVDCTVTFYK